MVDFAGPEGAASRPYADALLSLIIQSPAVLAVVQAPPGADGLSVRAARDACPIALEARLELGADSARIAWRVFLPPAEEPVDSGSEERDIPNARTLATTFWHGALSSLEAAIADARIPSSFVTIVGEPGTRVAGLGAEIVLPDSGQIDIPLVLPARVVWSAEAEGARSEGGEALVEESGQRILIPRRPPLAAPPWSIEASALGLSFPELAARYDFGKRLFARATLSQYFLGLSLASSSDGGGSSSILSSYGLLQPALGIGCLVSRREAALRAYASLDLFLRIAFIEGESAMLEPVAPWGANLALGADWGRSAALRIFLELGFVVYPGADSELMAASWSGEGMGRATISGKGFYAEFPQPRAGLRVRL
jgi:hypothetical protein